MGADFMADIISAGPPARDIRESYLAEVRSKRLMSLVLGIVFLALLVGGFRTADGRNAGGFWDGLAHVFDFPADVIGEAVERAHLMPGYLLKYLPSLIETVNIAAASTLIGGILGLFMSLLVTRGLAPVSWAVGPLRRVLDILRAVP